MATKKKKAKKKSAGKKTRRKRASPKNPRNVPEGRATEELQKAFIASYLDVHQFGEACELAGVSRTTVLQWERKDPRRFGSIYDLARRAVGHAVEDAAYRRSVNGCERGVYWQGMLVGTERVYSDRLAVFLLRGLLPDIYGDKSKVTVDGEVSVTTWTALAKRAAEKDAEEGAAGGE